MTPRSGDCGQSVKILRPGRYQSLPTKRGIPDFCCGPAVSLEIIDCSAPSLQKDDQSIIFDDVQEKVREDPPFQIFASAQSNAVRHPVYRLPVVLKVESGPAEMDALGVITLDGSAGTIVVSANQSGNAFVNAAPPVYLTIEVSNRTRPTILFTDLKKKVLSILYSGKQTRGYPRCLCK